MSPRAVLDTNVLLSATDPTRTDHEAALAVVTDDPRVLVVTPQIIRECVAVSTRPIEANGLGADVVTATTNAVRLMSSLRVISEDADAVDRLMTLVRDGRAVGRQVHDADIVATALAHGASTIITSDTRHFARFSDLIEIQELG